EGDPQLTQSFVLYFHLKGILLDFVKDFFHIPRKILQQLDKIIQGEINGFEPLKGVYPSHDKLPGMWLKAVKDLGFRIKDTHVAYDRRQSLEKKEKIRRNL